MVNVTLDCFLLMSYFALFTIGSYYYWQDVMERVKDIKRMEQRINEIDLEIEEFENRKKRSI